MGLDAALGAAETSPRKHGQAEGDGGRIQRQKFILEAELVFLAAERLLRAEPGQGGEEQFFEQRGGAVFVGIGQGRAARCLVDAQMRQFPHTAAQAVADLAQGIGVPQVAEQHGDELRPAGKALGGTLGGVLLDEGGKLRPRKVLEQLIEQARDLYDWIALLWAACGEAPGKERLVNVNYRRALLSISDSRNLFWTRV